MKTQRRHEMQTNVLADWLGHNIDQLRPYGKLLLVGAVAVAVLVAAGMFFRNDQSARLSAAWSDFFAASHEGNPERLRAVAADHSGTVAGFLARLTEADLELAQGMRLLYVDRDSAKDALADAKLNYQEVIAGAGNEQLRNAARFGLAQAHECLGELDEAADTFGQVTDSSAALFAASQDRIAALKNTDVRQFYTWFSQQKPVPRSLSGGLPGAPSAPGIPADLDLLSDQPDFSFPSGILGGQSAPESAPSTPDSDAASSPILPLQLDSPPPTLPANEGEGVSGEQASPAAADDAARDGE